MDEKYFMATMDEIVAALKERGYDPYAQLYGYVTEKDPAYITSYNGARGLILDLDFEQVRKFLQNMKK